MLIRRVPYDLVEGFIKTTVIVKSPVSWFVARRLTNMPVNNVIKKMIFSYDIGYTSGAFLMFIVNDIKCDVADMYVEQIVREVRYPILFNFGYVRREINHAKWGLRRLLSMRNTPRSMYYVLNNRRMIRGIDAYLDYRLYLMNINSYYGTMDMSAKLANPPLKSRDMSDSIIDTKIIRSNAMRRE